MENYLIQISKTELQQIIQDAVRAAVPPEISSLKPEPPIKGIHELARFLRISPARAQKLKNEGVFEYFQDGRLVLFDPVNVRNVWRGFNKEVKGNNKRS